MRSPGCPRAAQSSCRRFGANHIHAVPGGRVAELQAACTFLGISFELLSATAGSLQLSGLARPAGVLSG
jgi:hypothetical protein